MKKLTRQFLCACLTVLLLLSFTGTAFAEPTAEIPTDIAGTVTDTTVAPVMDSAFKLVLSNDTHELYYKELTAEVAVKEKASGHVFYTNPQDRAQTTGSGTQAFCSVSSQIIAYYYDKLTLVSVDSYTQSTSQSQTTYKVEDNKLIVNYHFGVEKFQKEMLPEVISRDRLEKDILPKLSEADQNTILSRYVAYFRDEMDKEAYNMIKVSYPVIDKHDFYQLPATVPGFVAEKIYACFVKAGYTYDDLQKDCDENGIQNKYKPPVSFDFEMEYFLNSDGFSVRLNTQKTGYDPEYPPIRVDLLPYFEAGGSNDEGYIFVPDGEGALIKYNNKRITADQYWKRFFAADSSVNATELAAQSEYSVLPVFGAYDTDSGYFASVDVGYESAGVISDIAGKSHNYNYVSGFFDVVAYDTVSISGKNTEDDTSVKYAPNASSCGVEVSYHLFSRHIEYDELAVAYRNHLKSKGVLVKTANDDSVFNAEFIGSARVKKNFLGFLYTKLEGLMTYSEASSVIDELGLSGVDVNYVNAVNGGKKQTMVTKVKPISALGNKKARLELDSKVNDIAFSFALRTADEASKSNSSFTLSREVSKIYEYDFISKYFNRRSFSILLAPKVIDKQIKTIPKSLTKQQIGAVNLTDIGIKLDSDFNQKKYTERYQAREKIQNFLKALDENTTVSVDYGSVYVLPYVDKIYDMPTTSSQYSIIDIDVPFYPIVVRGSVAYVTDSINTADDAVTAFLESVEIGAEIQYSWVNRNSKDLVDIYENYYNCLYQNSIEQAKDFGVKIADLFAKIGHSEIVAHKSLSAKLKQTDFASGHTVYVNYGTTAVTVGDYTVEPESFLCVETVNS